MLSTTALGLYTCTCPLFSNIFVSETAWPNKAKFYVKPPREEGAKLYKNDFGQITKMAATPIYSRESKSYALEACVQHLALNPYKLYINDDPGLTLTYFMARSNKVVYVFA